MVIVHLERKKRLTAMDTIPIRGNVQSFTFNHCIICLLKTRQFVQQKLTLGGPLSQINANCRVGEISNESMEGLSETTISFI